MKLQIFRAGNHRANDGKTFNFAGSDLDQIVASYNPALHEAPLVVGHPTMDAPAYGWVNKISRNGDGLYVDAGQLDAAFSEAVDAGRYKKVSASFFSPDHPSNPTPGQWHLRHVGFLGAVPPAVKGLAPIQFSEDPACPEFGDWEGMTVAGLFRGVREWIIAQSGLDAADTVLPAWQIDALAVTAAQPGPVPTNPTPTPTGETMTTTPTADFAEQQAAIAAERAKLEADRQKLQADRAALTRQGHVDFAEKLVSEGRLAGAERDNVVTLLSSIGDAPATVDFAEGGKTVAQAPADFVKRFLARLPAQVTPGVHGPVTTGAVNFSEGPAVSELINAEITKAREAGSAISAADALARLQRKGLLL